VKSVKSLRAYSIGAVICICTLLFVADYSFGDLIVGASVDFTNVAETFTSITYVPDTVHTYGTPTVNGNTLGFIGTNFTSMASGASGVDMTDGTLNVTIVAHEGLGIQTVELYEKGGYHSLNLTGGSGTTVGVAVIGATLEILDIEGGIDPVNPPPLILGTMVFTEPSPAQNDYKFIQKVPDELLYGAWIGSMNINVADQLVGTDYEGKLVTKARLIFDNVLTANSDAADTYAYIDKKLVEIIVTPVPEPSMLIMLAMGALGLGVWWRKRT
jgi:hypothetical protein